MQLQPNSILEIGTGFGKYGLLFREYLDIRAAANDRARLSPENWRVRIDGIECFAPYISDLQRSIYDRLVIGDALDEIDKLPSYDLVFLGNVIEHFPKEDGRLLLDKCIAHALRMVIVTTPESFTPQGAEYGNRHEARHSLWTQEDFIRYPGAHCSRVAGHHHLAIIPVDLDSVPSQRVLSSEAELVPR
jgi:hypothetical protein